jgi:uncharacterized protein
MDEKPQRPIIVLHTELTSDLLRSVIESFVLREGTDYGEREWSLQDKVARVIGQLERSEAQILFDPETQTVNIVRVFGRSAGARGN